MLVKNNSVSLYDDNDDNDDDREIEINQDDNHDRYNYYIDWSYMYGS